MDNLKQHYMTIFSLDYSSCGNYIAAGNSYGKVAVFNLTPFFDPESDVCLQEEHKKPFFKFTAHDMPIYSLISTRKLVISGSVGEINSWKWCDLKRKERKLVWSLQIPQGDNLVKPEVNSLVVSSKEKECCLYAGCGDSKVYCYDIETVSLKFILLGHSDYIHCVALGNSCQECISASEDGSVRIWDARKGGKEVHVLEPYKNSISARPQFGKWVGCVAYDESDDWLICGGAPVLCIWHLRSLSPATPLIKPDATHNVVSFHDYDIISGGSEPCVNHWSLDGQLMAEVPTSAMSVFNIAISSNPNKQVLCAAGSSFKIDVCEDFRFKEFSLVFS